MELCARTNSNSTYIVHDITLTFTYFSGCDMMQKGKAGQKKRRKEMKIEQN